MRENIYLFIFQTTIIFCRALCDLEYDSFSLIPQIMSFKTYKKIYLHVIHVHYRENSLLFWEQSWSTKPLKGYVVSTHGLIYYTSQIHITRNLSTMSLPMVWCISHHIHIKRNLSTRLHTSSLEFLPLYQNVPYKEELTMKPFRAWLLSLTSLYIWFLPLWKICKNYAFQLL